VNGAGRDEFGERLAKLSRAVPHDVEIVGPRGVPRLVEDVERTVEARGEEGADRDAPVYVFVFGVHRLRALRQDEDYMFSTSRDDGPPTGERFASVLRDGPERRVHSVVWCDSLGNVNRTFSRKTLREFDMRVLFQMSASDSSELIDETTANNLGLHSAILSVESDGTLEKFRPYSVPGAGYLEDVRAALERRFG
jgi:hypothetical protein